MVYSRNTSYLPDLPKEYKYTAVILVLLFAVISVWASPYMYDHGGSGRYLLKVIRGADPELYMNDPVADSLQEFDSAFYSLLALAFRVAPAEPQAVEPTMFVLYIVYKIMLFAVLYLLARVLTNDIRFYILLAVWALHPKPLPVGGVSLLGATLIHTEIAFLLCLVALSCLLGERRYFLFWVCVSLALLVHSLVALHFLVVIFPVYLIWHRPSRQAYQFHMAGILVFVATLSYYLLLMAPPIMSPEEGQLFLWMKGTMNHISPLGQSPFGWLTLLAVIGITLLTWWFYDRQDNSSRQLVVLILWGCLAGFALSITAISTASVRLALFQPMRILFWVWFCTNLLLLWQIFRQLKTGSILGVILIAAVFLFLLESLYALVFLVFAGVYILVYVYMLRIRPEALPVLERWTELSFVFLFGLMLSGWLIGQILDIDAYFIKNMWPVPVLLLLGLIAWKKVPSSITRQLLWTILLVTVVLGTSLYWYEYRADRIDHNWNIVQRWSRENTAKSDRFITTPDVGGNFRTGSFRTSLTEPMSALAWVDPHLAEQNGDDVRQVNASFSGGKWQLLGLIEFARKRGASYIITRGEYSPDLQPVFRAGEISIFLVEESTVNSKPRLGTSS